jgi:large exoprotein involved in heme utilization and adhesion
VGTNETATFSSANQINIQQDGIVTTESWEQGKAGNVLMNANHLSVSRGEVSSHSYNIGKTGHIGETGYIVLSVNGDLQIDAGLIEAVTSNQGNANKIELKVGNLVLTNGAQINASSNNAGKGGEITIEVSGTAKISGHTVITDPDTGKSNNTPSGIASSTFDKGDGGTIRISAQSITLDNWGTIQTLTKGDGNAGDIVIDVHDLRITNGGDIDASNEGTGSGKGGNITINATGSVLITAQPADDETIGRVKPIVKEGFLGGIYSIAENAGSGGDVTISTPHLTLCNGGVISVGSIGLGNAGNLRLFSALKMDNAAIITQATQAGGGDINIETLTRLHLINSTISAKAQGNQRYHKGGNLTIKQPRLLILDNSQLRADAYAGNGGDIRIVAKQFLKSSDSILEASSSLGVDGDIIIESPDVDLTGALFELPNRFLDASKLLPPHCVSRSVEEMSSFTIKRGKLLPPPDDLKTSTTSEDWESVLDF